MSIIWESKEVIFYYLTKNEEKIKHIIMLTKLRCGLYLNKSNAVCYWTKTDLSNMLTTHLGLQNATANNLAQRIIGRLARLSKYQIIHSCLTMKRLDINLQNTDSLLICLTYRPHTLEHRYYLLQELGIKNVTPSHIHSLTSSASVTIERFKEHYLLPPEFDLVNSMLNSIGGTKDDIPEILAESGTLSTKEIYKKCFSYYKVHSLNLPPEISLRGSSKFLSFRLYKEMLHILINEIKVDMDFIKKYPYVLEMSPTNARDILKEFKDKKIAGKDFIEILLKYPKILFCNARNMKEILASCKKYDIRDEWIFKKLKILRLDNQIFNDRITAMSSHPFISIWIRHSLILIMALKFDTIIKRVNFLASINRLKCAHIGSLVYGKEMFLRFLRNEIAPTAINRYMLYFIENEFGKDKLNLLDQIKRHPHWRNISFYNASILLQYLKKYYSMTDICENIQIIMYSNTAVIPMLKKLHKEYSHKNGYFFTPSQYLALCVYMLEKDNHFSGDGIWIENIKNLNETVPVLTTSHVQTTRC